MKTAVLIHGYHLDSRLTVDGTSYDWRDLALGHGPFPQGRASHGVRLAYKERAEAVIFSTGASEKDGLKEAEYTYQAVLRMAHILGPNIGITGKELESWLKRRVRLDTESQTTAEELERNLGWCAKNGFDRVFLATSRFHAPRALANATEARTRFGWRISIFATASKDPSPTPLIFEPPSRPDRDLTDFRPALAKIFEIPPERRGAALADIEAAIAKYL